MHFSGDINRPPYETADAYLQTTQGCSHNRCLFCTYFKDQKFKKSSIEEILKKLKVILKKLENISARQKEFSCRARTVTRLIMIH